tara:strand:- start:89 stop:274 length:186 start_codon:yes stop_codon:yes gene_type:complete
MNRVFKSDAEVDLNRCANALEKLVEIALSKNKRGGARKNNKERTDPITNLKIDNVTGRLKK